MRRSRDAFPSVLKNARRSISAEPPVSHGGNVPTSELNDDPTDGRVHHVQLSLGGAFMSGL